MALAKIYAHLSCTELERSVGWFTTLFGRAPDNRPMAGLAEWHHRDDAGLQLFQAADHAGHGTLTLIVDGLADDRDRLAAAGLAPGEIETADYVVLIRLRDPDGNLVVLAEPKDA